MINLTRLSQNMVICQWLTDYYELLAFAFVLGK